MTVLIIQRSNAVLHVLEADVGVHVCCCYWGNVVVPAIL
jgi:hypothetical protein